MSELKLRPPEENYERKTGAACRAAYELLRNEDARETYRDFGKGSGHAARLNLGDCFAYALAKVAGEPLLYKGEDFGRTDLGKEAKT